ncbi:MAG: 23S rRNA (guanosine(2251)-2'-O)-methyltransferase RlmB [Myxococcaceae bacterium]
MARPREESSPASGRYVFGVNPVLEVLRARPGEIDSIFVGEGQLSKPQAAEILSRARDENVRVVKVPRERLSSMIGGGVHQGVVAEVRALEYVELHDLLEQAKASGRPPLLVALDGVQDPQNFGAIIRSAHALGAHGVVIPKDRAAQVSGVVAKASAGAIEYCPVSRVTNLSRALEEMKEAGLWIAAADPEGDQELPKARLDGPIAVVVGSEGPGVRKGVLEHCDLRLRIPMLGQVASLNASVSAAILMYEVARQRLVGGK